MMKNECYIVRDLLPSYIDSLCSVETSEFVERHIITCEQCSQILNQMRDAFDMPEQMEIPAIMDQKKPFQKIAYFLNAQKDYTIFLRTTFWVSLVVTVGFFIYSLTVFTDLNQERVWAKSIDHEKKDIMEMSFAALSSRNNIDQTALEVVFQEYSEKIQHLAVFSTEDIKDFTHLQEGPTTTFPIDYSKAVLVIGENGKITKSIIPNDYDIGTVAMANEKWIVQYEYKESYLETVENAHQIKYYSSSNWIVFQIPILFTIVTVYFLGNLLYQKRITKRGENILN